jgi:hypothetical protein
LHTQVHVGAFTRAAGDTRGQCKRAGLHVHMPPHHDA